MITITATAINLLALIFLGAQVMLARRALRDTAAAQQQEWDRQRKQATIEVSVSTSRYREGLKAVLPWNDRDPEKMAAFLAGIDRSPEKLAAVREYLNHMEDLAVGVKQGVFDLETISMLDGSRIMDIAVSYAPYIENIRRMLKRPQTYSDIQDVAELIKKYREEAGEPSCDPAEELQPTAGHRFAVDAPRIDETPDSGAMRRAK
jgi:hypothetical protein